MFPQYPTCAPTVLCCTSLWEVKQSTTATIYCLHPLPLLFYCLHQHNFTISGNSCLQRWKLLINFITRTLGFPGNSVGEESVCHAGDLGLIPGSGRSPGVGNGNQLQYSCLENPMDREAGWAIVHGVAKSRTWLNTHTHFFGKLSAYLFDFMFTLPCLAVLWLLPPGLWGPGLEAGLTAVAEHFYPTVIF